MSKWSGMCWVLLLGLAIMGGAQAYEPRVAHAPLMALALQIHGRCNPERPLLQPPAAQARVIEGDIALDEGRAFSLRDWLMVRQSGVFSRIERIGNWHFYHPDRQAYSRIGQIEASHQNLWLGLQKGFAANAAAHDKLLFVGGLGHLLEDLSVPAHVVPVYHGPTAVEYLGPARLEPLVAYMQPKGLSISDRIDAYPPDIPRLSSSFAAAPCALDAGQSLEALRLATARATLALLAREVPDCPGVRWQAFWLEPKAGEYFGRYNLAGQSPLFGDPGILQGAQGQRCAFAPIAEDKRYRDFVFALHQTAIAADLQLLAWAQRHIP